MHFCLIHFPYYDSKRSLNLKNTPKIETSGLKKPRRSHLHSNVDPFKLAGNVLRKWMFVRMENTPIVKSSLSE